MVLTWVFNITELVVGIEHELIIHNVHSPMSTSVWAKMPLHLLKGGKNQEKQSSGSALISLEMYFDTVIWDNGPSGQCVHDSYRMTLSNSIK